MMNRKRNVVYGKPSSNGQHSLPVIGKFTSPKSTPQPRTFNTQNFAKPHSLPYSKTANVTKVQTNTTQKWHAYSVLWCTRSNKVHKSYDNGYLLVSTNKAQLLDLYLKSLALVASYSAKTSLLKEDDMLVAGTKEIRVEAFLFELEGCSESEVKTQLMSLVKIDTPQEQDSEEGTSPVLPPNTKDDRLQSQMVRGRAKDVDDIDTNPKKSKLATNRGRLHLHTTAPIRERTLFSPYSTNSPNAVTIWTPPPGVTNRIAVVLEPFLAEKMRSHQIQGVKFMYECVTGLHSIVNDDKVTATTGCILADSMGLGKTLQAIALIRIMITQSPLGPLHPHCTKVIVVTPTSLVHQWSKEVKKWLGFARLNPICIGESNSSSKTITQQRLMQFIKSINEKLLIISYEQLKILATSLVNFKLGLIICDEGHRLKNPSTQMSKIILSLDCSSRIILTGTPFQNNLSEYYSLVEFVNPGSFESWDHFRREYEQPILAARNLIPPQDQDDKNVNETIRNLASDRIKSMNSITSSFILQRKNDVLEEFLPTKIDQVIFCYLTQTQIRAYQIIIDSLSYIGGNISTALPCITQLLKICNHPELIFPKDFHAQLSFEQNKVLETLSTIDGCSKSLNSYQRGSYPVHDSSKMIVLIQLIHAIRTTTTDKIVIISSFTKTLDMIQIICQTYGWTTLLLDGRCQVAERNSRVQRFQSDPSIAIFLLSTKAGGVGLNLYAANRLILFDSSWNPAFDAQAQARIWRDGQTKVTWIYRLLCTGTIDEKIFQCQLSKSGIGNAIMDNNQLKMTLSQDQDKEDSWKIHGIDGKLCEDAADKIPTITSSLNSMANQSYFTLLMSLQPSSRNFKDIFNLNNQTLSETHDLSGCQCLHSSTNINPNHSTTARQPLFNQHDVKYTLDNLYEWQHYSNAGLAPDPLLKDMAASKSQLKNVKDAKQIQGIISFILYKTTQPLDCDKSL